ncbi:hypothetical protein [Rhodoplanes sp. SY1]|uniref:hypothetical protein n=1 Tax=Rhodoplanes sp. SY1 TaxID=3166646 RepID=UPI0038B65505
MSRAGAFRFFLPGVVAGLSVLVVSTVLLAPRPAAAAPDCLTAPDGTATEGRRWFYRLDHSTGRKCWYLKAPGESRAAPPPSPEATGGIASAPGPATPVPATPLPTTPLAGAPVQAATDTAASGTPAAEPGGRSARPLDAAARDALYREFLAWRLQQPAD